MKSRLNRYFFLELAKVFFLSILIAELVLLGLQGIRLSALIINQGLEWRIILRLLGGLATSFLPAVVPISFLFSLLIVFGRMAFDRELVALQAMGYGARELLRPASRVGFIVFLFSLFVAFYLGPLGNRNFEIAIDTIYKKKVTNVLRSGTISEGFLGMVIFVDKVDPISQRLDRVFLYDEQSFTDNTAISARWGQWVGSESGAGVLRLYDGLILMQSQESDRIQRVRFDQYSLNVDFSVDLASSRKTPASQDINSLLDQRRIEMEKENSDPRQIWAEVARRFSVSLACLLFVPLSFLLALDNRRDAKNRAVFTGLVIVVSYWLLYFSLSTLYQRSDVPLLRNYEIFAWIFIGAPNLVMLGLDILLYRKRLRVPG